MTNINNYTDKEILLHEEGISFVYNIKNGVN